MSARLHEPLCSGLPESEHLTCDCPHVHCAQKTALRIGRDAMDMGLRPFLVRLVGAQNAQDLIDAMGPR